MGTVSDGQKLGARLFSQNDIKCALISNFECARGIAPSRLPVTGCAQDAKVAQVSMTGLWRQGNQRFRAKAHTNLGQRSKYPCDGLVHLEAPRLIPVGSA